MSRAGLCTARCPVPGVSLFVADLGVVIGTFCHARISKSNYSIPNITKYKTTKCKYFVREWRIR